MKRKTFAWITATKGERDEAVCRAVGIPKTKNLTYPKVSAQVKAALLVLDQFKGGWTILKDWNDYYVTIKIVNGSHKSKDLCEAICLAALRAKAFEVEV